MEQKYFDKVMTSTKTWKYSMEHVPYMEEKNTACRCYEKSSLGNRW